MALFVQRIATHGTLARWSSVCGAESFTLAQPSLSVTLVYLARITCLTAFAKFLVMVGGCVIVTVKLVVSRIHGSAVFSRSAGGQFAFS